MIVSAGSLQCAKAFADCLTGFSGTRFPIYGIFRSKRATRLGEFEHYTCRSRNVSTKLILLNSQWFPRLTMKQPWPEVPSRFVNNDFGDLRRNAASYDAHTPDQAKPLFVNPFFWDRL
jgi:hypothetical protein